MATFVINLAFIAMLLATAGFLYELVSVSFFQPATQQQGAFPAFYTLAQWVMWMVGLSLLAGVAKLSSMSTLSVSVPKVSLPGAARRDEPLLPFRKNLDDHLAGV